VEEEAGACPSGCVEDSHQVFSFIYFYFFILFFFFVVDIVM
jgi:hypothetical protein